MDIHLVPGGDVLRGLVRSILAPRAPEDADRPPPDRLGPEEGEVGGPDEVAVPEEFPLDPVELPRRDADGRENCLAVGLLGDPDEDVAPAVVVEVVRERADAPQDVRGVPALLELHAIRLYIEVDPIG